MFRPFTVKLGITKVAHGFSLALTLLELLGFGDL
jgi:hypothetical protein